jgi:hypothetical protein
MAALIDGRRDDSGPDAPVVKLDMLQQRFERYMVDHYAGLHNTVAGVVLAVAGVAAASLVGSHPRTGSSYPLLWMFWLASFLLCATIFAGAMSGNVAAPPLMPRIIDLLIPLVLGVGESMLFAVPARQVSMLKTPSSLAEGWFISLAIVCTCAAVAISRAMHFFGAAFFDEEIRDTINKYRLKRLPADRKGALIVAVIGIGGAAVSAIQLMWLQYILAGFVIAGLLYSLHGHSQSAAILQEAAKQARNKGQAQVSPQAADSQPSAERGLGNTSTAMIVRHRQQRVWLIVLAIVAALWLTREAKR